MDFFRCHCDRNRLAAQVSLNTGQLGDDRLGRVVLFLGEIQQRHFTQGFGEIDTSLKDRCVFGQNKIFGPNADIYRPPLVLGMGGDRRNGNTATVKLDGGLRPRSG